MKALLDIQHELKAPKNQMNKFGGYKYRSCEDILEAVKPLLSKHECTLFIADTLENIGERYYVKATATIVDKDGNQITTTAFAREEETKKGMDASQITGTASSYARKYCLNGLFLIDDTKDADTNEYTKQQKSTSLTMREKVLIKADELGISPKELAKDYKLTANTTEEEFAKVLADLEGR